MGSFVINNVGLITTKTAPGASANWGDANNGIDPARPTDDASLKSGINSLVAGPALFAGKTSGADSALGTWLIRFGFNFGDNTIALDGNPAISFNSLPAGAVPLTATLRINVSRYPSVNADPVPQLFFQRNQLTESGDLVQVDTLGAVQKTFAYTFPIGSNRSFLDILGDGFGIRVPFTISGFAGQRFYSAFIDGTYEIINTSWTLDTPSPVSVGDTITISSNPLNLNHLKLNQLTPTIKYVDNNGVVHTVSITNIITQTEFLLEFELPTVSGGYSSTIYPMATGNGVQFSGSVLLGSLSILIANGSGIYRIITNKTNDTLYRNSAVNNTTADVKIPNPFIETGFIGG